MIIVNVCSLVKFLLKLSMLSGGSVHNQNCDSLAVKMGLAEHWLGAALFY